MDELSSEELVGRFGVTANQLRRLVELGVITPTPQGRFGRSDIQGIRVADALADAGFALEQLSEVLAAGADNLVWASVVFSEPTTQLTTTLKQTAAATGRPEDLTARLFDAWELPRPQPGQALRADDDELLHQAVPALEGFGGDQTALLGVARQLGARLRRLAESQVRLFHARVEQRLGAAGRPGPTPPGPAPGDCLPGPDRLPQAHRGARRHGRGRAGRPAGRARPRARPQPWRSSGAAAR